MLLSWFLIFEINYLHQSCIWENSMGRRNLRTGDVRLRLFSFYYTLGPTATQDKVYTSSVQPLVQYLLTGYNAAVFCYGKSGSGETYTLEGGGSEVGEDKEGGIVDRVAQDLFLLLEEKKRITDNMETTVCVSYLELYREELRDLLEQPTVQKVFYITYNEKGNTVHGDQNTGNPAVQGIQGCESGIGWHPGANRQEMEGRRSSGSGSRDRGRRC
uniref:Kinesin motor domain-containing protein n=1 Tax=Cynoglossus semilaevis TaxID=244447 RepID=A0A3P8W0V4_CYNSE